MCTFFRSIPILIEHFVIKSVNTYSDSGSVAYDMYLHNCLVAPKCRLTYISINIFLSNRSEFNISSIDLMLLRFSYFVCHSQLLFIKFKRKEKMLMHTRNSLPT